MKEKETASTETAVARDSTASTEGSADKMDQIRELMFGSTARDFERRIGDLAERLESEVARVARDFEGRIAALEARLDPQIEKINGQLRQETMARTAALDDVDVRFGQSVRTQRAEINAVLQQHEDNADAMAARASEALSQTESRLRSEVRATSDALAAARLELGGEKLAREDLADLMAELSLRLRGKQGSPEGG